MTSPESTDFANVNGLLLAYVMLDSCSAFRLGLRKHNNNAGSGISQSYHIDPFAKTGTYDCIKSRRAPKEGRQSKQNVWFCVPFPPSLAIQARRCLPTYVKKKYYLSFDS